MASSKSACSQYHRIALLSAIETLSPQWYGKEAMASTITQSNDIKITGATVEPSEGNLLFGDEIDDTSYEIKINIRCINKEIQ